MPSSTSSQSNFYTFLLLTLLLVAFFPGLFHYLSSLPLAFLFSSAPSPNPQATLSSSSTTPPSTMSWFQKQFSLPSRSRGSYLVTDDIVSSLPEIRDYKVGLLNLFVQHTSCALSLNENWDEDVRADMSDALDRIAPESGPKGKELYRHSAEGPDDMPAHIKSALIGASVTIPIKDGDRYMARNMVSGVSGREAYETGYGYNSGREIMKSMWRTEQRVVYLQ